MKIKRPEFLLVILCLISNPALADLEKALSQINSETMRKGLTEFVNFSLPGRFPHKSGHLKAREWIKKKLSSNSFSNGATIVDEFLPRTRVAIDMYQNDLQSIMHTSGKTAQEISKYKQFTEATVQMISSFSNRKGENIIWRFKGKNSSRKVVVMAHYDTVSYDLQSLRIKWKEKMPGADYNASGVITAISLAQVLSQNNQPLPFDIDIVFMDYHVIGFLGAEHYFSKQAKNEQEIIAVLNLEMLGYDSSFFDKEKKSGNMKAYTRSVSVDKLQKDAQIANKMQKAVGAKTKVQFQIEGNNFQNSDNVIAWKYKHPCVTFSQNWETDFNSKGYQTPNDFPETLNFNTLYESLRYLAYGLSGL
jgi:Zn-dependent M28 family amino/carboxypeptidase